MKFLIALAKATALVAAIIFLALAMASLTMVVVTGPIWALPVFILTLVIGLLTAIMY